MYVVTPFPDIAYALDLTKPARRSSGPPRPTPRRWRSARRAATRSPAAKDRQAEGQSRQGAETERRAQGRLSAGYRRQGLATRGILATHRSRLGLDFQHLHGRDGQACHPYSGNSVRRHGYEALRRARRSLGRHHRLESGDRQKGLVDRRTLHDYGRCARHGRGRDLLRHHRRLVRNPPA